MIFRREFCGREASFVSFPVYFVMPILCVHCLAQTCALTMQLLLPCPRSSDVLKCCLSSDFFLFSVVFSCYDSRCCDGGGSCDGDRSDNLFGRKLMRMCS